MPFKPPSVTNPALPDWLGNWVQESQQPQHSSHIPGLLWQVVLNAVLPESTSKWLKGEYEGKKEIPAKDVWGSSALADIFPYPTGAVGQIVERSGAKNLGAFLHRTMHPDEMKFLEKIMKKGETSDVSASIFTPQYRSVFHGSGSEPGLVFSVKDPENIKYWHNQDVGSGGGVQTQPEKWRRALSSINEKWAEIDPVSNPELYERYKQAWYHVNRLPRPRVKEFSHPYVMPHFPEDYPLNQLLDDQANRLFEVAARDPNMRNTPYFGLINEVAYKMGDPREVVGVRIPRPIADPEYTPDIGGFGHLQPAYDFAKRNNLPIWQFTPQTDPEPAARGIIDYLTNPMGESWYRRTTEEFPQGLIESTADPLAKYYGRDLRR